MRVLKLMATLALVSIVWSISACSDAQTKSPDVSDAVQRAINQAGLKDVDVSQNRDKGVVTLTGTVASDDEKSQAEMIAKSIAPSQVVSNRVAVRPPGAESIAKKVDSDLDKGIEKNVDAELVKLKLDHDVKYDVKNGVVTLTGSVHSQSRRSRLESIVKNVPNVQQVVNELEVKNQKATSSQ
jgi:hyperosmotically inducible periplasmic protein